MGLVRKGSCSQSRSGFQRSPVSISASSGCLCFHEMLSISETGSPHFCDGYELPLPRHVSAVLSSVVRSVGKVCLLHGKHALGGGTGGKITLALLWRHLAAQVPAEGPSALLRPQPRFSVLFRNTLLCRPERALLFFPVRRGCSGPGKLRSKAVLEHPSFSEPAAPAALRDPAARPELCSSRGRRWVSPGAAPLAPCPARPGAGLGWGRRRRRSRLGGGRSAARPPAAENWRPLPAGAAEPRQRERQLRAGTGHERGTGGLKELGRSRAAGGDGEPAGQSGGARARCVRAAGAAAPRGWRFVLGGSRWAGTGLVSQPMLVASSLLGTLLMFAL